MTRASGVTAGVFVVLGLWVVYEAHRMTYSTPTGPGPGLFPFWLGCLLALLGLVWFVQVLVTGRRQAAATAGRSEGGQQRLWPGRAGALRVGAVVVALLYAALAVEWLGFRLTMLTVLIALLVGLGRQRLIVTAIVSVTGSFGVYYVFTHWLSVQLPPAGLPWLSSLGL
ncbi:MAG: hypothetical protein GEV10_23740 [Streptosporangiales bacterium]|nr:hypothetical protein [Streptosporangiales bacterium]